MADAPDGEFKGLGPLGRNYPSGHAVLNRVLKLPLRGVHGGLGLRILVRLVQLGADHETEVRRLPQREGHVGIDQRGQLPHGRVGGSPYGGEVAGQRYVSLGRQGGQQRRPVGEVVVGRSRADSGFPCDAPQAYRADAFGFDELQGRVEECFAQRTVVVAGPGWWHVMSVRDLTSGR